MARGGMRSEADALARVDALIAAARATVHEETEAACAAERARMAGRVRGALVALACGDVAVAELILADVVVRLD